MASSRFARTLTARAVLATCVVSVVSVLVTAAVAIPLAGNANQRTTRERLNEETILTAQILRPRINNRQAGDEPAIVQGMRQRGIDVYLVRAGVPDRDGLPDRVVLAVSGNRVVNAQLALVNGRMKLVAGRPVPPGRNGVVLVEDPGTGGASAILTGLWIALAAGLIAGVGAGVLLARRTIRPIRAAAAVAARLSAGDRSVRLEVQGPAEAEDLAAALNNLAAALTTSEGRQRDFLLSVSHELRTPLTTIKGYAEALSDGVVGPDGAQRAGKTVLAEAARLERLIADLLVLARLEAADLPIELMPVDLTQLVVAAGEAWGARAAAAGLLLRVEVPPIPVYSRTDPGRVRQILDGLLENALRVVPAGCPVVLAVQPPGPDGLAWVEIRDGGPGFTDDDLAVAFERGALYQRYRGVRQVGSGLGLALAERLARRLGGTIEAGHAPEGGARFTVGLPAVREPAGYEPTPQILPRS
jgi:signal transduction histidine kinase